MPTTKLDNKNHVAELIRSVEKLEAAAKQGPRVKIPGTNLFVDLKTGLVYLEGSILDGLRAQNKITVDNQE